MTKKYMYLLRGFGVEPDKDIRCFRNKLCDKEHLDYSTLNNKKNNFVFRFTIPKELDLWNNSREVVMSLKDFEPMIMTVSGHELTPDVELTQLWLKGAKRLDHYLTKRIMGPVIMNAVQTLGCTIFECFSMYYGNRDELFKYDMNIRHAGIYPQIIVEDRNGNFFEKDGKRYVRADFSILMDGSHGTSKVFYINKENPEETLKEICEWFEEMRIDLYVGLLHLDYFGL